MKHLALIAALTLAACDGGPSSPTPTSPQTSATITGAVTTINIVPAFSFPTDYRHVNYVVTTTSSKAVTGCYVEVKWLDAAGVQIGYTYASTDATIPEGVSTMTDQDYMHKDKSSLIKDSLVGYSLCR